MARPRARVDGQLTLPIGGGKRMLGIDVLTAARRRIRRVFTDFPNVYVSFSGGKDSGVLLELAAVEARTRGRRLGVLIVDLEAQYAHTIAYIEQMLQRHADVLDVHWVCLPLGLRNAVSHFEPKWMCWDPAAQERWVRPRPTHPGVIADENLFPFFRRGMEFEELVPEFGQWYARQHGGRMTACLVAIRTQESLNRWRTLASTRKKTHSGWQWTTWIGGLVHNAYPIYDWRTEDVWRFYGREKVPYNPIYDLMHRAGLTIHQARLCQPYGDDQRKGLWLFHVLEPETWTRVVSRVQGANFGALYARETGNVLGRVKIEKPDGLTWQQYATRLLDSMPPPTAESYRAKITRFLWWYEHNRGYEGGRIPDDGPLGKGQPSWRRICKALLTFDYYCIKLTFSPPAHTAAYEAYKRKMRIRRQELGYDHLLTRGGRA